MLKSRAAFLFVLTAGFASAQPTYTREISRILEAKCQRCHRAGDIAPFALDGYEIAADFKDDIKRVVSEGLMPPWKPVPGYGEFRDNFSLTEDEKNQIYSWVDSGAPKGDDADMPPPPAARGDWALGEPDLVLQMPEAYTPPRGRDMYRCFVLPTEFTDTKFVSAADILPGDRRYVHHVILYLDTTGGAEKLDAAEEGPGYTCFGGPGTPINISSLTELLNTGISLGGWAPGTRPAFLPAGTGMQLPPKTRVVMQVHYYARGGTGPDQTKVGLYFNKERVQKRLFFVPVLPLDSRGRISMEIPAGAPSHKIDVEYTIPLFDVHVVNVFPHMHLLGREIKSTVVDREGKERPLIYIDNWDFNWQGPYTFTEPVAVKSFSKLKLSCTYNNSESNPRNPNNPVKTVNWGEGTEDEMCVLFAGVTFDAENLR